MRLPTRPLLEEVGSSDDADPSSELKELVLEVEAPYDEAAEPEEPSFSWVRLCLSVADSSAEDSLVPSFASLEPSSEEESPVFDDDGDSDVDSSVKAEASPSLLRVAFRT